MTLLGLLLLDCSLGCSEGRCFGADVCFFLEGRFSLSLESSREGSSCLWGGRGTSGVDGVFSDRCSDRFGRACVSLGALAFFPLLDRSDEVVRWSDFSGLFPLALGVPVAFCFLGLSPLPFF